MCLYNSYFTVCCILRDKLQYFITKIQFAVPKQRINILKVQKAANKTGFSPKICSYTVS